MTNYVSNLTVQVGDDSSATYDIRESFPHVGTCSTAAATAAKEVTIGNFKLYTGAWVVVKFNNTNSAAVASLTLNVDGTGAKPIKYRNANLGWAEQLISNRYTYFIYDGTNYQIVSDFNSDTYDRTSHQTRIYAGTIGVFNYSLCALDNNQRMQSFTTTSGTGTSKVFNTSASFMYPPVIMYNAANSTYANGTAIANNVLYEQYPSVDLRYSCNVTSSAGFTQYKPVYLECTINSDGTFKLTTTGLTQTFTNGKYYILLGCMYNTSIYQLALFAQHPMFYYDGTHLNGIVYTATEKTKLSGIANGATKVESSSNGKIKINGTDTTVYSHPTHTAASSGLYKITVDTSGHVSATAAVAKGDIPALDYVPNTKNGVNAAINLLDTGSSTPTDADYYISQYVGGGTTTTTYHRRPMSALWSYVKGKADSVYSPIGHAHTLSIATDSGTNQLTLSANTKYKLTAGGNTFVFTTPANPTVNNASLTLKGAGTTVTTFTANSSTDQSLDIVAGSNVTVTADATNAKISIASSHPTITKSADTTSTASPGHGGTFTVVDSVTREANGHVTKINTKTVTLPADSNTDTLVSQTFVTADNNRPLLMSYYKIGEAAGTAQVAYRNDALYFNPSGGILRSPRLYLQTTGMPITINLDTLQPTAGENVNVLAVRYKNTDGTATHTVFPIGILGNDTTGTNPTVNSGVRLGSTNGTTIVGAGESSVTFAAAQAKYNDESLYLVADQAVYMYTDCSNDSTTVTGPWRVGGFTTGTAAITSGRVMITDGTTGGFKASDYTIAKSVPSDAKFSDTTYSAGTGLSLSGTTFNHSNSVTEETSFNKPFVKYDAQGHITASSYWSATAIGTGGEAGWVKIATMKHTKTYDNTPIMLTVSQRGNSITYKIHIVFKNANNTDPDLDKFYLVSDESINARAYIIKSATSTWDLYIRKLDNYEAIAITLTAGRYFDDHMEWTWTNVQTDESLITGGTEATKKVFYNSLAIRTANTVLAAPNGSDGQATFRKLVAADIPDLDYVPNTQAGMNAAINLLSTGNATPALADYYVSQFASGGTTTTTYHRRPISAMWDAFKGLITLETTGTGNAVTAVSIANDGDHNRKITVTKGSTFSLSTHTHNYAGSSSAGGAATSANKLNTNAGDTYRPVYFTGGVPEECETPSSGSWFKGVPYVGSTGVMEIGKYIDFHGSNTSTADYDLRLEYDSTTTGHTITIPPTSASMAVNRKSLITDSSSDFASYAWHKFAEVTITSTNYDYFTTFVVSSGFIVSSTYAAKKMGLLTMHVRTDSTRTFAAGEFEWLVAGEQIDPNNFVMVHTDTANTSCKVELWYKQLYRYEGFTFTILEEHTRTVKEIYTMKLYDASGHGSATYTTGSGDPLISKLGKIKNAPGIYAVKGTQTAATSVWTGEIDVSELYDGLTIAYYLPYASTSTSVTLNLTLADGTTTGAIDCYYTNTSRITTHYGAGSTVILTYWSAGSISVSGTATTNNRWTRCDYNSNSSVTQNIVTASANRPLLMSYYQTGTTTTTAQVVYRNDSIYANPSTGAITANKFYGDITGYGLNAGIYDLITVDDPTFNGAEWMLTSIPSSSGGTATPSFRRVKTEKFADYVTSNSRTVLFNDSTNTSTSITLFTPPTDTQYLKLYFRSSGNNGQTTMDNSVYSIAEVPYMTDVNLGGILQVAQPADNQGFLRFTALAFTIRITNHTLTLTKASYPSRLDGSVVANDTNLSANIIKVVAYR